MKRSLVLFLFAGACCLFVGLLVSKQRAEHRALALAQAGAALEKEKAALEAALEQARRARRPAVPVSIPSAPTPVPTVDAPLTPEEIIAKLIGLPAGSNSPVSIRQSVYWLEELAQRGPTALPAIGEFLARYEDVELDTSMFEGRSARLSLEFLLPPSVRFGLFEVVQRIGGAEAEKILVQALTRTGRGVEVAYLTRALQGMAPGKYRAQALAVTRALLAGGVPANSNSPLDRNHRDYLFSVLTFLGDTGFAREAQTQLVRADSQVDRSALKYLQQTLGPQSVPLAAQAYQNPMLTNSAGKEPLARLALNFVGADPQANTLYEQAINDPILTQSHRKNLIEDLNQDGFADTKNLQASDLPLIENRMSIIEQLAPSSMDQANLSAFKEAYKDLVNMRAKITGTPPDSIAIPGVH